MKKIKIFITLLLLSGTGSFAQFTTLYDSYKNDGEFGASIGLGHYFGDLNINAALNRPKFSGGIFFIKQFNNYIGLKVAADYTMLGYSDVYSNNETQKRRNLSFNTNLWEVSLSGYFNFFRFIPGVEGYENTPYLSLGIGAFSYDPYAYLNGTKYFLRPLSTEGQGTAGRPAQYNTMALCVPVSVGYKKSINNSLNVFAEIGYRFTNTDYLDDVSTTYAGVDAFPPGPDGLPTPAYFLQDRSYEKGVPIGIKDRQRGNSSQKDAYIMLHAGVSLNLTSYKCPKIPN